MVLCLLTLRASLILLDANAIAASSRIAILDQSDFVNADFVRTRASWLDVALPHLSHFATTAVHVDLRAPRPIAAADEFESIPAVVIVPSDRGGRAPPV